MRAIRVSKFGGEDVLKLEKNVPIPQPKEKQVLIKVFASGINPVDTYIRSGTYAVKPSLPYTPGADVAGVIESVGPGVQQYKKGDRVFTARTVSGGYAEYAVADVSTTQPLDDTLTFEQGAGIGVPYFTAYRAVRLVGKGKPGDTILVHGASGAVGLACVQIANSIGMTVIGTAGTEEGMDIVSNNGADIVINHREDRTNDHGPNLIIEMLANVNLETDMKIVVGNRGTVEEEWKQMHAGIQAGMKVGWLKPHIAKEYTLEQAASAHRDIINNSGSQGKLVIKI
ncbi:hypothetical protein KUTeg_018645 [Tegillarca granosa]|uniref:Enoyl reductase (ER) domain-containing protein n=1 Tax=Tegillarca granosa TaxID=220873 RepID=A0ABQ9EIG0_TEGGR|nr:hypothetical protein KUTeg_018645 [Tegillarca granosa]